MGFQKEYGALLEAIANEADAIAMRYFRAVELRVDRKGDGTAVTQADRAVEEMARARVAESGLEMDVLGEEMGGADSKAASNSGRARMIIDPIDGTEEFSRGIPTFGTLMGIEKDREIIAGMASAPGLHSRWWAYRGEGAYRNGKRIHVSNVGKLRHSMVFATGTGPSKNANDLAKIRSLLDAARNSRSFGGFWQHMLVAEGAVEAALDWTSKPWDLAPLGIIVQEAGGRSTNLRGERDIYSGKLLSTNGKIHEEALALLR
ncbi:MAG TPA: inositol monophosphatase family protein [Candidatus Acidoferrum sp.]|nr:inositol monophosphatase family protein [Candidatus Acidoferrum sp.]